MDEHQKEEGRTTSDSSILSRSEKILQAATPYLDSPTRQILESVARTSDFVETLHTLRRTPPSFSLNPRRRKPGNILSMTNLSSSGIDAEGLLRSIRPFCTHREGGIIDQIMNVFNMRRYFSMYQTISSIMSMMNAEQDANPSNRNGDFSQLLNIASMMGQMNHASPADSTFASEESPSKPGSQPSEMEHVQFDSADTYWNSQNYSQASFTNPIPDSAVEEEPSKSNNNQQMYELVSSMIPPEQKGILEAMKLLIDSGLIK